MICIRRRRGRRGRIGPPDEIRLAEFDSKDEYRAEVNGDTEGNA